MILYLLALAIGCAALYGGGDLLVRGASGTGRALEVSPAIVGLLFVSLGTSAPELFVSAGAALQGYGDVAAGNALGSNIVNLCLVLGLGTALGALDIEREIRDRQLPLMVAITLASVLMLGDAHLGRLEGASLLGATALGLWWVVRGDAAVVTEPLPGEALSPGAGARAVTSPTSPSAPPLRRALAALAGGVVLLLVGAEALIYGGVGLAAVLGVPDAVVALTVTSIGTGLPEITATVLAAVRREHALAVANVVGSNMLNLGFVLGGSALLRPIDSGGVDLTTFGTLVVLSLLLWALAWRPGHVSRAVGAALLAFYAVYVLALIV